MSETFTPGPYHVERERLVYSTRDDAADEECLCSCGVYPTTTNQANATLFAAAPDLLAACEAVLRYISSHQVYDKDARGMLERAIVKAKGEAHD